MSLHIYTPLGRSIEEEYAEIFSDFEDGIIELRQASDGGHEMRLAMRMAPVEDTKWHRYRIIGTSFVIEKGVEAMAVLEAGLLAGLGGSFVTTYGAAAAKWLWEETERLIERVRSRKQVEEDHHQSEGVDGKAVDTLLGIKGEVPSGVGLQRIRKILPDKLNDMMLGELNTAREEVEIYHKRYLKYKALVAEAGDYAEQREERNRDEALGELNAALFRLMKLVKAMYGKS